MRVKALGVSGLGVDEGILTIDLVILREITSHWRQRVKMGEAWRVRCDLGKRTQAAKRGAATQHARLL